MESSRVSAQRAGPSSAPVTVSGWWTQYSEPARPRQVLRLRFLEELSVREAAERLDRSEDAVVALTKRALTHLRESRDGLGEFTRGA
jgi:hypothetical protein